MLKAKHFIRVFLLVALAVSVFHLVSMKIQIAKTAAENEAIIAEMREQKLRNEETAELLSEENSEDFMRKIAEQLGYCEGNEKVYVGVSGQK